MGREDGINQQNVHASATPGAEESKISPSSMTATEYGHDKAVEFDKGLKAWLQVLGAFFMYFNSWYDPSHSQVDKMKAGKEF